MSDSHLSHAPITVAIVSTNHLVRIGFQSVLTTQLHMRFIGDAPCAREARALVAREQPHVLVIEMESDNDISELVRTVKTSVPTTKIILLGTMEDNIPSVGSVSSGIDGIVLNIQPAAVLLATINHVCCVPAATTMYERSIRSRPEGAVATTGDDLSPCELAKSHGASLTGREEEIIRLIGQALSNKAIAERLCISSITVRHHLTSIFGKFDVNSRQQLLLRAYECGILKLGMFH